MATLLNAARLYFAFGMIVLTVQLNLHKEKRPMTELGAVLLISA
jgi:hypothetical protein